jgi:hypothetical protein
MPDAVCRLPLSCRDCQAPAEGFIGGRGSDVTVGNAIRD